MPAAGAVGVAKTTPFKSGLEARQGVTWHQLRSMLIANMHAASTWMSSGVVGVIEAKMPNLPPFLNSRAALDALDASASRTILAWCRLSYRTRTSILIIG
jgi:hypothetical protein